MLQNNPFEIAKQKKSPLILDGAMGSMLQQKGYKSDRNLWMSKITISNPEVILEIHKSYINAGADIITTNTFRSNPAAFEGAGYPFDSKYVNEAVRIAKQAIINSNVMIAGSNPPAEDCYQSERKINNKLLQLNHINHINLLINNGVDFILNETQSHFDEIKIICDYCSRNNIPYILSIYVTENLKIFSGEDIKYVIGFISDHNPLAVGFNCITPSLFRNVLPNLIPNINWGFYLNCGSGNPKDENIICGVSPAEYVEIVDETKHLNPSFIGSCCGSTPNHIKEIKKYYEKN